MSEQGAVAGSLLLLQLCEPERTQPDSIPQLLLQKKAVKKSDILKQGFVLAS